MGVPWKLGLRNNTGIPVYCSTMTKNIVLQYIFSIPENQVNWSGSESRYGLGIPKFWFKLKWLMQSFQTWKESQRFWYCDCSKSLSKAKECWPVDFLRKEFEVGPFAIGILSPWRLTQSVQIIISYSNCKFINYCMFYFLFPPDQWTAKMHCSKCT